MTTIKEAREIVRALVDDPHTAVDDVMIAVDAAMLTVLKKALSEKDKPHPFVCADPERECWGKPPCWVHKLIQQIEELG